MYLAMSSGGVFETVDQGRDWRPLNAGCRADFLPDPYSEFGHDTHRLALHPQAPDILYQQNHCGIYRLDRRQGTTWVRIGENMPKEVGDIGFPLVLHPRDPQTLWVFPMDGTEVWPRTARAASPPPTAPDGGASGSRTAASRPAGWYGQAPGHVRGLARPAGPVFRHDERRALDERRRRKPVALHRPPSAGDLRC
jgi:hypothetical protein